ncbi:MAG TPA: M28 family peptidase [Blastocatellia bacterium]|nr:M28 family peptidase [Blastocatellia bacterium]
MKNTGLNSLALAVALAMPVAWAHAQRRNEKAAATPAPAHGNADYITADQLRDYLTLVASDEMEGRDTPSRGLDTTAKYIASQLSRWGLKPAGDDGTWFQRIALRRERIDPARTHAELNGQSFNYGDDFLASNIAADITGPVVYVSHGWVIRSKNIDALSGVDVKDKVAVLVDNGLPKDVTRQDLTGKQGEDWDFPINLLRKRGAKCVLIIPSFNTLANWQLRRQAGAERGGIVVERFQTGNSRNIPVIWPSPRMLSALFQGEKQAAALTFNRAMANDPVEAFDLSPGKTLSLKIGLKAEPAGTQNVVALLEGSDPALKGEYVAIGAHYDHVGIGAPVNGDAIYNGADDDGSGTVAVLAMAEAFARGPRPRRSILFIWHAGEEKGLWGSRYFTDYPTVPLNQIVAQLNIDMIGRTRAENDKPANQPLPKPGEIFLIGPKMMSTELLEISEAVNKSYLNLHFDYKYDDIKHPDNFFFRSDHYNYARKGIPIIFYMDGEHEDYHRPSDTADKIDYRNMEKVTRTIYATGWELANRANRPRVDRVPTQGAEH